MATSGKWAYLFGMVIAMLTYAARVEAGIVASLDRTEGTLDDVFTLSLEIEGSFQGEPDIPKVAGLTIRPAGRSQSTQIINGVASSSMTLSYQIEPQRAGNFRIPEISMKIDGKTAETLALEFRVTAIDPSTRRQQDFFIERELSKPKAYVGEVVYVTDRIYLSRDIMQGPEVEPMQLDTELRLRKFSEYPNYQRTIEGKDFQVIEQKFAITASKSGTFTIPRAKAQVMVQASNRRSQRDRFWGGLFNNRGKVVRMASPAQELTIEALPTAGRKADFSGLVGDFDLEFEISDREVKAGDNIDLKITVKGRGSTVGMADIELNQLDESFVKVYRDKSQDADELNYQDGVLGERHLRYALIPQRSGKIELGNFKLQFFNAESEEYETINLNLGDLEVAENPQFEMAKPKLQKNIEESNEQVENPAPEEKESLIETADGLSGFFTRDEIAESSTSAFSTIVRVCLLSIGLFAFLLALILRTRGYFASSQRRPSKKRAFENFHSNMKRWHGSNTGTKSDAHELQAIVRNFFAELGNTEVKDLTTYEIISLERYTKPLAEAGVTPLLTELEAYRFGDEQKDLQSLGQNIEKAIRRLEPVHAL